MGSIEQLKQQTGLIKKPQTFQQLLEVMKPQIHLALPRHLNADRMIRIALTAWRTNQKLAECEPQSIIASVMIASQLGLEPGIMGQCYLIPYKNRGASRMFCQLVPGWMGIMDLVNRSGKATAWTGAVYQGDEFDWSLGDRPHVTHKPCGNDDPAQLTHVWAVARSKASEWPIIEVWTVDKVKKHRDKINKVGDAHYSFQWLEQYARKVVLLQVLKYVPRSIELMTALSIDEEAEAGGRQRDIREAVISGGAIIEAQTRTGPAVEEPPQWDEEPQPASTAAQAQRLVPDAKKGVKIICNDCRKEGGQHTADCKYWNKGVEQKKAEEPVKPHQNALWKKRNAMLWAKANEQSIPVDDIRQYAKEKFLHESCSDLTYEQLQDVIGWLDYLKEQKEGF